ncbi:hypothetical protein SEA_BRUTONGASTER_26 [Gordonia phage BrutonGaster]|uniref:Head-to-tail stopper n=1 Tax=Gordonia phage BrutonGaster TaxID=2530116 RepID=A0A482JKF6_9CAUD|nr:head closure Hc1 [Gordonia phage BrutonGaster]QBP33243.1 hypothetical protein SEA_BRUTONGASTER_26 [Gordonia phage BrutonGaster]
MGEEIEIYRQTTTGRVKHGGHAKGERERDYSHTIDDVVISYDDTETEEAGERLRDARTMRVKIWVTRGSDILAQDRIKLPDGLFYRIDGKPLQRKSGLTGNIARTKILLIRTEG